ncbi:MAG: class I SAM-dependent methyltransferase [Gammaproteobacteria bacterium]
MFSEQNLPQPDEDTARHCELVEATLKESIAAAGGAIRFDEYMRFALYEPGLGYYVAGTEKFGREGDFITAPELGPLFGSAVAEQCSQVLSDFDAPEIFEFGGGSGAMAASVLSAMQARGELPARYTIIELSPELRRRQAQYIEQSVPELRESVHWMQAPPDKPFQGCIIANEILDALPVRCFQNTGGEIRELWVHVNGSNQLAWEKRPIDEAMMDYLKSDPAYALCLQESGYRFEICSVMPAWVASLDKILEAGAALLIDYGSGRRERFGPAYADGSLRCFLQHRINDQPLIYPGGQDITASVDFTSAAEAAVAANMQVAGFVEQAHFLTSCGILQKVTEFQAGADERTVLKLNEQLKTLLLPTKMGTRFKVMALTKNYDRKLLGFTARDDRRSL